MLKRDLITNVLLILSTLTIFVLLRLFVFKPYTIREMDSNSYLAAKDYVIVVKHQEPDYGDFVLYMVDGKSHVGRVMGRAGDTVTSIEDIFYRNQEVVEQEFLTEQSQAYLTQVGQEAPFTEDFSVTEAIPQDNYFILNDNRRNTADSREFGLIPRSKIKGVLTFRLYPLDRFGFIGVDTQNLSN